MDAFQRVGRVKPKGLNAVFTWAEMFPESDDPEMEFVATWDRVRVPAGDDILAMAIARAKERPLQPRNCISQGYGLYVSIAGRLQELRPGDYINLPVERLAKALERKETTVSYYAQCAKKDGYISLIAKHHQPSRTAAKYEFHTECFDLQTGEELKSAETPYCSKDSKDSEDGKDAKEGDEKEATDRTLEEVERKSGLARFEFDVERGLRESGAQRANKDESIRLSERQEELKRQIQFLERKSTAGS